MLFVLDDSNISAHAEMMDDVYLFRHKLFVERLGWEGCRKPDGREIDDFDGPGNIHIVLTDGSAIIGYSRLLPSTRPHLQSTVFRHLAMREVPSGSDIWEWTRCGVLPERRERRGNTIDVATGQIFTAVAEVAARRGFDGLLAQTHPMLINRLMSCGWDVDPLGLPTTFEGHSVMAVYARSLPDTVAVTRDYFSAPAPTMRRTLPPHILAAAGPRLHA